MCEDNECDEKKTKKKKPADFGPKSDEMGHRIIKSIFFRSDFACSGLRSRVILFLDRKIES